MIKKLRRIDIATIIVKSTFLRVVFDPRKKMFIFDMPESPVFTMSVNQ